MPATFFSADFGEQVDTNALTQNLLYILSSTAVVLALLGLILIDTGLVRRQNVLTTSIQKIIGFLIGTVAYMVGGFALWNFQYYQALGVEASFGQAFKDWWFGGSLLREYAQNVDPAVAPGVGNSQIFFAFLALYGGFVCALLHTSVSERIRSGPYYIICAAVGGIVYPVLLWLTWGSTSPLTNAGVHDFVGAYTSYIFAGVFGLVLTLRLRPRAGLFPKPGKPASWIPNSVPLAALGVVVLLFAAPLIVIGCGFIVPGEGFYGVSMTTTGLGLIYVNVIVSFVGGGAVGAVIAYATGNPTHALLGPLAGYVANTAGFDVLKPWETLLVAVAGQLVVAAVYTLVNRRGIDDAKVFPLACAAIVGDLIVGALAWGTPTGGYFGLTGEFGFQHAHITLWWQLVGVAVTVAIAVVSALLLVFVLGAVMKLRVTEEDEITGADSVEWTPKAKPNPLSMPADPAVRTG
ncbi:ammonium transporter [Saccharopolyspora sp. NPDC000995]